MTGAGPVSRGMKTAALAALVCLLASPGAAAPRSAKDVANTLRTRRISVAFEKAPLEKFVDFLRKASGLNIVVKKKAIEKAGGDADAVEVTLDVQDVTILDALKLVLEPLDLGMKVEKNILFITSKKDARGKPVLVIYNVSDVLMEIRDFPAADINIHPSDYEPPEPPEPEVHRAVETSEELAELVRQFTGRDTWEDENVNVTVFRRHLFIRQYPAVHAEIRRFLAAVRGLR